MSTYIARRTPGALEIDARHQPGTGWELPRITVPGKVLQLSQRALAPDLSGACTRDDRACDDLSPGPLYCRATSPLWHCRHDPGRAATSPAAGRRRWRLDRAYTCRDHRPLAPSVRLAGWRLRLATGAAVAAVARRSGAHGIDFGSTACRCAPKAAACGAEAVSIPHVRRLLRHVRPAAPARGQAWRSQSSCRWPYGPGRWRPRGHAVLRGTCLHDSERSYAYDRLVFDGA